MTSQARIDANRRNARRSTGPRTSAGKARASRNARQHGLSIAVLEDAEASAEAERLALTLAGVAGDRTRLEQARSFAQAELDLLRVRAVRRALMSGNAEQAARETTAAAAAQPPRDALTVVGDATAMLNNLLQLERLERYERRAMSRRKKALRALRG
jgi:hypothetical protein